MGYWGSMGDNRFGFSTHFDQGNPVSALPVIFNTGVSYIRDDFNWTLVEKVKGIYDPTGLKPFWQQAFNAGLKCVAICGSYSGNPIYTDPFDATGLANFCAFVAQTFPGIVIEVTNEPNNTYQGAEGVGWQTKLVTLTTACYDAVHAVSSTSPVIGYGAQGQDILTMLGMGGRIDGVVYHPYDPGDNVPEHIYSFGYTTSYTTWVSALRGVTSKPIWETERNSSYGGEYQSAVWNARRYLLSLGLGIEHSFLYDFMDTNPAQSLVDLALNPRQPYYVLQRIIKYLGPLTVTAPPTITPGASDFDVADLYTYAFSGLHSTVATAWLGNHTPNYIVGAGPPNPGTGTVTFPVSNPITSASKVVDPVRGFEIPLSTYRTAFNSGSLSVFNFPINEVPLLIVTQ